MTSLTIDHPILSPTGSDSAVRRAAESQEGTGKSRAQPAVRDAEPQVLTSQMDRGQWRVLRYL